MGSFTPALITKVKSHQAQHTVSVAIHLYVHIFSSEYTVKRILQTEFVRLEMGLGEMQIEPATSNQGNLEQPQGSLRCRGQAVGKRGLRSKVSATEAKGQNRVRPGNDGLKSKEVRRQAVGQQWNRRH